MRKLAIAALSFSAAIFAANYLFPLNILPLLAAVFALLGALLLFARRRWLLGLLLAVFGVAFGCFAYWLHAQFSLLPAIRSDGTTLELQMRVLDYPQELSHSTRLRVRPEASVFPLGDLWLYDDSGALRDCEPGDRLKATVRTRRADLRYGEKYDSDTSKGIYATASLQSDPVRFPGKSTLTGFPQKLNRVISQQIDRLFPQDVSAFLRSLMLGDKSDLYQDTQMHQNLSRAGLMHIVAVSGMHVAFLVGLIQLLLGKSRFSSLLCLVLVWLFVLVTGASPSAVRAAIMLSVHLFAPIVHREEDPVTSLSAALALILLVNPNAAASVSLQLSFAAMAGLLCFAERWTDALESALPETLAQRLRGLSSTAASSLAVLVFTVPLTALHFGTASLLSPLSNLLCLWTVSLCFCGAYLSCGLSFLLFPLGKVLAEGTTLFARYILFVAKGISAIPFATIYLHGWMSAAWIGLVYLLFFLSFASSLKIWKMLLVPLCLSGVTLALMLGMTRENYAAGAGVISVLDVGQGQCICTFSGEKTLVIDCGSLWTHKDAGEAAGGYLRACGRDHVDVLVLTHLHEDHCSGVPMLLEMIPVQELILSPNCPDEEGTLAEILAAADRTGTRISYLEEDTTLCLGDLRAQLYAPGEKGDANERCVMALVSLGSYDMLVTADSSKAAERELLSRTGIRDVELLIVGHHGSRYASSGELLEQIGADTAIISVGNNNFAHPTYETLERLAAYGYTVYRTDLNGTVEIRIGDQYGEENGNDAQYQRRTPETQRKRSGAALPALGAGGLPAGVLP